MTNKAIAGEKIDLNMVEATEITQEIQSVIDEGLFPFQQVRLLIWESLRRSHVNGCKHGGKHEVQHHIGNPKLCRVTGLKLRQLPECEGGGWYTDEETAKIICEALNHAKYDH